MTAATRDDAKGLLGAFLQHDVHYRASSTGYGDAGPQALTRALDLFLARPEIGFVWLAFAANKASGSNLAIGASVVCFAISTARGSLVVKLDDVSVDQRWHGRGVGSAMLKALIEDLRTLGITRIDSSCHRANVDAWRFYERLGFKALDEERIARLVESNAGRS